MSLVVAGPNPGGLLTAILALSPAACYPHDDTSLATMRDASSNARTGSYGSTAKLKAVGIGGDRTTRTAYRSPASNSANDLAHPATGAVWNSNSWTHCAVIRVWGFEDPGSIWVADTNGVFSTPAVRLNLSGGAFYPTVCHRDGSHANTATRPISDTYRYHFLISRVNALTAGSIRLDGVDVSPASWTSHASYSFSGTPTPSIGDPLNRVVLQYSAWWGSHLSDANCQSLEAAFLRENFPAPVTTTSFYIGTHSNVDDQSTAGIRHNQTRVAHRDGANITRSDFYPDTWNTAAGVYDFSVTDDIFSDCASKSLRVWVLAHSSSAYTRNASSRFNVPGTGIDSTFNTWLGQQQTAWEAFATRYKPGGTGNPTGLAPIYEWWNEPNAIAEWKTQNGAGGPDATQWARFAKTMKNAVAAIDPNAIHVTGGVNAWSAPGGSDISGEAFWRTAIATGDLDGFTNFGIHPYVASNGGPDYNPNFDNSYNDFAIALDVLGELGRSDVKLWITEVGWSALTSAADQDTKLKGAVQRWRDVWRAHSPAFVFWPDWDENAGVNTGYGLYSTMPADGSDPTARAAAATYSSLMGSVLSPSPLVVLVAA